VPKPLLKLTGEAGTESSPVSMECIDGIANAWKLKTEGANPEVLRRRRSRRLSTHPMQETLVEFYVEIFLLKKILSHDGIEVELDIAEVPEGAEDAFDGAIQLLGTDGVGNVVDSRRLIERLSRRRLETVGDEHKKNFDFSIMNIVPTCDSITWEYAVTYEDSTGQSEPISVFVKLDYGDEKLDDAVPTTLQTRCDSVPYGVEDLEESRVLKEFFDVTTLTPSLSHRNCPNPFLYMSHSDTVIKEGTPCTTDYKEIEREWILLSHSSECSVAELGPLTTQTIILGGGQEPNQEPGTFTPATPVFSLTGVYYELPYIGHKAVPPIATISTTVSDFYLDNVAPKSECGLCSDPSKEAIVYSHPQDFDCSEEGENEITITVLNNIGITVSKTAAVTIFGLPDSDEDGSCDVCDPDDDNDGVLDPIDSK
jgi:hypothetical protein